MRKGIYSAVIALMALVLAIAILSNAGQKLEIEKENTYSGAAIGAKAHWQNSWLVLNKAAGDAIADSVLANSCTYNEQDAQNKISSYFSGSLEKMWRGECKMNKLDLTGNVNSIRINATIECGKEFGEKFSVSYAKQAAFEKELAIIAASPCGFSVEDKQSGVTEVTYP